MRNAFRITLFYVMVLITCLLPELSTADSQTAFDVLVKSESYMEKKPVQKIVSFYQDYISPHDGAKCMFTPTCSQFYKEAHLRYGFFWSTIMTVDRLFFREGQGSMKHYKYLDTLGRYQDPIYHNYIFNRMDYYK